LLANVEANSFLTVATGHTVPVSRSGNVARSKIVHQNLAMDQREARRPPEYILEVFADPTCIKDVVRSTTPYSCNSYFI